MLQAPAPRRKHGPTGAWTENKVAMLRQLWGVRSASEIAEILGCVSRNAVIGKAGRLGLTLAKVRSAAEPMPRTATEPMPDEPSPAPAPWRDKGYRTKPPSRGWASGAGLTDRSPFGACQYLHGEARDRDFCGAPVLERPDGRRSSYCPEHHALCWQPLLPRSTAKPKDAA
ncbi:hypothetical protein FFK22_008910 [Mycobacterium sp. KBS0706]|nr:hypothetical protein FFK22_008910 [Mycobacterium sp. KBS0706]